MSDQPQRASLSVAIITFNEEENIGRTLASVKNIADEIIVVDSGSTDRTVEIAKQFGAKVVVETWKGFAAQKNSALDKCTCDWILSLDADEEVSQALAKQISETLAKIPRVADELDRLSTSPNADSLDVVEKVMELEDREDIDVGDELCGFSMPRRNYFLARWIKGGGFYPDRKVRLFRSGAGGFSPRRVHEDITIRGVPGKLLGDLIHHQYPTLTSYIEHMNRYSSLGAEMVVEKRGRVGFSILNIVIRPVATFLYNYFFRLGFLDGKEGLLLHLYHSVYVSWKYAKAWELSRKNLSSG